jgi:hypothetical protein
MGGADIKPGEDLICGGEDVIQELNDVFGDPTSARYQYAQSHNTFGGVQNVKDNYSALIEAYNIAKVRPDGRWAAYLRRLGTVGTQGPQNIYDIAQIRYHGLTEGVIMLTAVHMPVNGGHVRTVRGSKAGLHSSIDSPCPM